MCRSADNKWEPIVRTVITIHSGEALFECGSFTRSFFLFLCVSLGTSSTITSNKIMWNEPQNSTKNDFCAAFETYPNDSTKPNFNKKWRSHRQIPCLHTNRSKQLNFLFPNLIIRLSQSESMPFRPIDTNEDDWRKLRSFVQCNPLSLLHAVASFDFIYVWR